MNELYAHVVDNTIKQIGIRRGSVWNGKKLGLSSPDETYASLGLYPITGSAPSYDSSIETLSGPTYNWNAVTQEVEKNYTVTAIDLSVHKSKGCDAINLTRSKRSVSGIPYTTTVGATAGTYTFCDGLNDINAIKTAANDIKSGLLTFTEATGGYWKCKEGVEVEFNEAEFLDLSKTITLYIAGLARESHNAKDSINAATTKSEIDAIVSAYEKFDPLA